MERVREFFSKVRDLPLAFLIASILLLCSVFILYYPIGMFVIHKVDDDPGFGASKFDVENGSHAVSIAAALIDREINRTRWTPNAPFFSPASMLERMPAFQRGVMSGLSRFAVELADEIGRTRGSSQVDTDLEKAAGLLKYRPDVWLFDFSVSVMPTASSEKQYQAGLDALMHYNRRLSTGQAVFERRADNLIETIDRFATDLGSASAALDNHIQLYSGTFLDTDADTLFYRVKGQMYAYYLLMRELEKDYAALIEEKQLQNSWKQTLESLREGAEMRVFFVFNSKPDSQFFPNHLAEQGFYLVRARMQMREITNILLK